METIGLIGVGTMGRLMTECMKKAGYTVIAMDNSEASKKFCVDNNVEIVETKAELAQKTKKIICSLPSPKVSKIVAKELAEVLTAEHIVTDTSTMAPTDVEEIAAIYENSPGTFVEGGILGRPSMVGHWTLVMGGDKAAVDALKPALLTFCAKVVHSGKVTSASTIKVLNNALFGIMNAGVCEVFVAVENAGVDQKVFYDIVSNSQSATNCGVFKEIGNRIVTNKYDQPNATIDIAVKDTLCGQQIAQSAGMSPTLISTALQAFENTAYLGLGKEDTSALYKYLRQVYPNPSK